MTANLDVAFKIAERLDVVWTFMLLLSRFSGFFSIIPGLGEGSKGLTIRIPAIAILSYCSMVDGQYAPVPSNIVILGVELGFEYLLGMLIGTIPLLIVNGVQTGAQLASSSMGFGANQLLDPTTGGNVSDLGRLMGDLTTILFLIMGGDHVVLQAVSGFSGSLVPGSYVITELSAQLFIDRAGDMLRVGILLSAPVVVALLLTQFVMGLLSRAVPTINIFIVSFPLTIGIGLFLSVIALPDVMRFVTHEFTGLDNIMLAITRDAVMKP